MDNSRLYDGGGRKRLWQVVAERVLRRLRLSRVRQSEETKTEKTYDLTFSYDSKKKNFN